MMTIGAIYRAELAQGLKDLGFHLEKTYPDGQFEIAGVSHDVILSRLVIPRNAISRGHTVLPNDTAAMDW